MSNYTLVVPWSGKDALSDSDAAKVISGADFNTEFSAVQTAVNTKADINGSASESFAVNNLTIAGTSSATTATAGNNTTTLATTAFVTTAAAAVAAGITTYTLPAATSSTLGGVKASLAGTTLTISTT